MIYRHMIHCHFHVPKNSKDEITFVMHHSDSAMMDYDYTQYLSFIFLWRYCSAKNDDYTSETSDTEEFLEWAIYNQSIRYFVSA